MGLERIITRLVKRLFKKEMAKVHTCLIGQVVSYDGATNTCSVIPVQRRIRVNDPNNTTTIDLPQLDDVPVKQFGSGKLLFSVAPQEGSYGKLVISERSIEQWQLDGGIGDPASARRFDISDAIFESGMYPVIEDGDNGLIVEPIQTDRIEMRTRSAVTSIAVKADETLEIKNEKCTIVIDVDGNVTLTTDGAITATAGDTITLDNGTETASVDGAEVKAGNGTDFVAMALPLNTYLDALGNAVAPAGLPVVTPAPGAPCPVAVAIMASHAANAGGPPPAPVSFDSANLKAD